MRLQVHDLLQSPALPQQLTLPQQAPLTLLRQQHPVPRKWALRLLVFTHLSFHLYIRTHASTANAAPGTIATHAAATQSTSAAAPGGNTSNTSGSGSNVASSDGHRLTTGAYGLGAAVGFIGALLI